MLFIFKFVEPKDRKMIHDEDALEKLMKEKGLLSTSPDFTAGVMNLIERHNSLIQTAYKPLISGKVWALILMGVILLIVLCVALLSNGNGESAGYFDFMNPAFTFIRNLDFTLNFDFRSVFIGILILITTGVFLVIDFFFDTRKRMSY